LQIEGKTVAAGKWGVNEGDNAWCVNGWAVFWAVLEAVGIVIKVIFRGFQEGFRLKVSGFRVSKAMLDARCRILTDGQFGERVHNCFKGFKV